MNLLNKLVLGTMKLKKYFFNTEELTNFLEYAHDKGIRQLHVSNEYSSYTLIKKSLKKIKKKKFVLILKLPEPNKDNIKFNLKKFEKKIFKYRNDLGKRHKYIVQLVNRYKCKNFKKYLINEQKTFDTLQDTIVNLKRNRIIKSFYFFPYHRNQSKIKNRKFINGITCYRNLYENQNDIYAVQNNFKIIAMRTYGQNKNKIYKKNLKKLIMFNLKSKLVKKVIVGTNNKTQLDQLLKIC